MGNQISSKWHYLIPFRSYGYKNKMVKNYIFSQLPSSSDLTLFPLTIRIKPKMKKFFDLPLKHATWFRLKYFLEYYSSLIERFFSLHQQHMVQLYDNQVTGMMVEYQIFALQLS